MPELISPSVRWHAQWLAARDEWQGAHQDGTGLSPSDDVDTPAGFATWVAGLHRQADRTVPVRPGWVHASYWWLVDGDTFLGAVSLRHYLNDFLLTAGGHIGYGIRPSARRHGHARYALGAVLPAARALGLDRVLLTCDPDNVGSARTIEGNGGVLEDVRDTDWGTKRRYWIAL